MFNIHITFFSLDKHSVIDLELKTILKGISRIYFNFQMLSTIADILSEDINFSNDATRYIIELLLQIDIDYTANLMGLLYCFQLLYKSNLSYSVRTSLDVRFNETFCISFGMFV